MNENVVTVGSGPAGLSAALHLLSNGFDVTVVDRFSDRGYSRYHSVCGAGISARAFRELEFIDPSDIRNRIDSAELVFPGDVTIRMKVDGYVLDRVAFLNRLKSRCAELGCGFTTSEVVSVKRRDSGFEVLTRNGTLQCGYLIGCDGAHSIVRRELFGTRPMMIPVDEFIVEGEAEPVYRMILGERYDGLYEWSFPAGDNVCIGSGKGILKPEKMISRGARDIPFGGIPKISDGRAFLCGDAAGMPNPVSGGGLRLAMLSGQEAAREIENGTEGSYRKWWDRSVFSSPRFMRFRDEFRSWSDEELAKASRPFRNGRNVYLWGPVAGIMHPKYIPMYIGCLRVFKHGW